MSGILPAETRIRSTPLTFEGMCLFLLGTSTLICSAPEPRVMEQNLAPPSAPAPAVIPWLPEESTETIKEGERHHFIEYLERDSLLHLKVGQNGVDVRIEVTRASKILRCVDLRIGSEGTEEVWWSAPDAGSFGISIHAPGNNQSVEEMGTYTILSDRRSAVTEAETQSAEAQAAASRAMGGHRCKEKDVSASELAEVAKLWQKSGNSWQEALAWAEAGRAMARLDPAPAVRWLDHALGLFERLEKPGQKTRVLLLRAGAFQSLGQLRRAHSDLQRAIEWAERHDDRRREAKARNNLAVLHLQRGDYAKALANYRRAADLWRELASPSESQALNGLADTYIRLGEMEKARNHLTDALTITSTRHLFRTLLLLGWWHYLEKDADTAFDYYDDAARQLTPSSKPTERAGLLDRMGSAHMQREEWNRAELRYQPALAILESHGPRLDRAHTLSNLARLYLATDRPERGLEACNRALEIFRWSGDRDSESYTLWIRAQLFLDLGDLHRAENDLAVAVDLLEELRRAAGPPATRARFLAERIEIHRLYVEVSMQLHQVDEVAGWDHRALNASERARARSLLDLLSEAGVDPEKIDPEWLEQERWLTAEIAALDHLSTIQRDEEQRRRVERSLEERLRDRAELLRGLRESSQTPDRPDSFQTLEVREISELLEEDTLLLAYGLGSRHLFSWWINSSGMVGSTTIADTDQVEPWAAEWSLLVSEAGRNWDWRNRRILAKKLRSALLEPAAESIGNAKRLVIVGDGALRNLPFAALPALGRDEKHLIETHEITYLSSASTLASMRRRSESRPLAPEPLFAVGDPVYDSSDDRFLSSIRNGDPGELDRLKHSGVEIERILAIAVPGCQDCALLGFDANVAKLRATDLTPYRILHFAAHSKINRVSPNLSAIRLSRFDPMGAERNAHLLRFYEVFHLDLPAELVTLSACSTALGEELPGEGLLDLSRAFNYAGIPRSVMTLWDVRDESTSLLMTHFYDGLFRRNLAPGAALRHAQLSLIADGREPYEWAPFVLQGDWRPFVVLDSDDRQPLP